MAGEAQAKAPIVYTAPEYSFLKGCPCPTCGKEMDQAVYYVAEAGPSYSTTRWEGGRNVKTTTTHYNNIRSRVGGFCPDCWKKAHRSTVVSAAVIAALIVGAAVLGVVFYKRSEGRSVIVTIVAGFFSLKWLIGLLGEFLDHRRVFKKTGEEHSDAVSRLFVGAFDAKTKPCLSNEVLIDTETMRGMQQQNHA